MPALAGLSALFLAALALRPQLVGIGPLLPRIGDELAISHTVAGLLGTIPVLCMGLLAIPARRVSGGTRRMVTACLLVIGVAGLLRAFSEGALMLVALTIPVGIGMGVANALMPVAAKEGFADRPGFATGVYSTGIQLGAIFAASLAAPLAATGSWRLALATLSAAALLSAAAWFVLAPRRPPQDRLSPRVPPLPWRDRVVLRLVGVFALVSIIYYALVTWLPDIYVDRGWSEGAAAALLVAFSVVQAPAALLAGWLSDRLGSRRPLLLANAALILISIVGFAALPGAAWTWAVLSGIGNGALFALAMTLPLDVASTPRAVGAAVAVMLGAGYLIAALGPVLLGTIRDLAASYATSLWLLSLIALALVVACLPLGPRVLRPRPGLDTAPSAVPAP